MLWSVVSQWSGAPVPLGVTTTKPSCRPRAPNPEVKDWSTAPSSTPWKSRTSGRGEAAAVRGPPAGWLGVVGPGVVSRYHRVAPATSRPWSWSVTDAPPGRAQPLDGTGPAWPVATRWVGDADDVGAGEALDETV